MAEGTTSSYDPLTGERRTSTFTYEPVKPPSPEDQSLNNQKAQARLLVKQLAQIDTGAAVKLAADFTQSFKRMEAQESIRRAIAGGMDPNKAMVMYGAGLFNSPAAYTQGLRGVTPPAPKIFGGQQTGYYRAGTTGEPEQLVKPQAVPTPPPRLVSPGPRGSYQYNEKTGNWDQVVMPTEPSAKELTPTQLSKMADDLSSVDPKDPAIPELRKKALAKAGITIPPEAPKKPNAFMNLIKAPFSGGSRTFTPLPPKQSRKLGETYSYNGKNYTWTENGLLPYEGE